MTARALTYAIPVHRDRVARARRAATRLRRERRAGALFATGDVHFASVTIFDEPDRRDAGLAFAHDLPPLLVIEQYVDEETAPDAHALRLATRRPGGLHALLSQCVDYGAAARPDPVHIARYLHRHAVAPSLCFAANPRVTCARAHQEATLRDVLRAAIDGAVAASATRRPRDATALHELAAELAIGGAVPTHGAAGSPIAAVAPWVRNAHATPPRVDSVAARLRREIAMRLLAAVAVVALPVLPALVAAAIVVRRKERADRIGDPATLDPAYARRLASREDRGRQNHLGSLGVVKSGRLRRLLLRAVFLVARSTMTGGAEGGLARVFGIHHAQWTLVDGGRRLLFLTNYDSGWSSYLDDFVDVAARPMTAIWSNTVDFPRTRWLVLDGAKDRRAFKTHARGCQTACALHYADYPTLSVEQIAANARLREGLALRPADRHALDVWARTC